MWKTFVSLASFAIALVTISLVPSAAQEPTKVGSSQGKMEEKAAEKPGGKAEHKPKRADEKPAGKGAGSARMGVPTESEKLLDEAIAKIEKLTQYRSDVRQTVEMLGYKFVADGQYAVGPEMRMLFELKTQLTDPATTATLKEVCDGKTHWKFQQVIDTPTLVKIDVQKIKKVMDDPKFKSDVRADLIKRFGFSGIVPILHGLRDSQTFASHEEEALGDVPVYALHGTWLESAINQSTAKGVQLNVANLPAHIPDKSTVWIGRENGWPYKIRLESTKKAQSTPTVITLEFVDPTIDVELPESLFTFEPPTGLKPEDQTDQLYRGLSQLMQVGPDRAKPAPIGVGPGGVGPGPANSATPRDSTEKPKKE